MARRIEVEFYGTKGYWSAVRGWFRSVESLRATWDRYLAAGKPGHLKDDDGHIVRGIWVDGYRIITPPPAGNT